MHRRHRPTGQEAVFVFSPNPNSRWSEVMGWWYTSAQLQVDLKVILTFNFSGLTEQQNLKKIERNSPFFVVLKWKTYMHHGECTILPIQIDFIIFHGFLPIFPPKMGMKLHSLWFPKPHFRWSNYPSALWQLATGLCQGTQGWSKGMESYGGFTSYSKPVDNVECCTNICSCLHNGCAVDQ